MFHPQASFFDQLSDRLALATYDTNQELRAMRFKITEPTFFLHKPRQPGEVMDFPVGPHKNTLVGGHGLVRVPQFEEIHRMSAIDRIKAKAIEARGIAGEAIQSFEGELDSILAEKDVIKRHIAEAAAPHHEIFKGIRGELDGLKSAIDLLSNGGPDLDPLPESGGEPKA